MRVEDRPANGELRPDERAEEQLQNEIRLRLLIENGLDNISLLSPEGRLLWESPATVRGLGYQPDEWVGRDLFDMVHPDDAAQVRGRFVEVLQHEGARESGIFRVRHRDGSWRWLEAVATNRLQEPSLKAIVLNYRDITARKLDEERIRESETRFRSLYENATIGLYQTTPDGRILMANPALVRMLGYSSFEELATRNVEQEGYEAGYERGRFREALEQNAEARGLESRWMRKDGSTLYIRESGRAVRNEAGQVMYYEGTVEDVTERTLADEAIRVSEERYRSLFDNLLDGYAYCKMLFEEGRPQDFIYLEVNPAFEHLTGLKDVVGKKVSEVIPGIRQSNPQLLEIYGRVAMGGAPERFETCIESLDLWLSIAVYSPQSEHFVAVFENITQRRRADEQVQRQVRYLSALKDIDRVITSSFGLSLSLETLLAQVTTHLQVDAADVLLFKPGMQALVFTAGRGFRSQDFEKTSLRLGEGYAGRAALDRRTIYVPVLQDARDNSRLAATAAAEGFVSYYAVPLIAKGKIAGVLQIFHRSLLQPNKEWEDLLNVLAGQAALALDNGMMFENLQRSSFELSIAYDATIAGWSHAMDLRDKETEGHTERVTKLTLELARHFGFSDEHLAHVRRGALLHDIGKMGVPDSILLKPGALTEEEWKIMRQHPQLAHDMLASIDYLRRALDIPYCHHEKWDGTGYPRGLKGEQIPLEARIFAAVDVWDALTSDRPYRPAWTNEKALEYIRTQAGAHFDPAVVETFLASGLI